jgi:plasmid stabilization system protein ParE
MSRRYQLTPLAEQDVRDIVFYIAERFGLARAERAQVAHASREWQSIRQQT